MITPALSHRTLLVTTAAAMLCACGGSQMPSTVTSVSANSAGKTAGTFVAVNAVAVPSTMLFETTTIAPRASELRLRSDTAPRSLLYASLAEGEVIYGYKLPRENPICSTQLVKSTIVNGIGTDTSGTLWVPTGSTEGGGAIYSYAPKCGAQGTTLSVPTDAQPTGIAFASDGTKYGLMDYTNQQTDRSNASVAVYPSGATSPTAELTDPRLNDQKEPAGGVGIDAAGNIYVTCCGSRRSLFAIEFPSGQGSQKKGKKIPLQQLEWPGAGITFDGSDNMIVPDQGDNTVKVYAAPYTGKPSVYPLEGRPGQCTLSPKQTLLACGDFSGDTVDVYAYPALTYQYSLKPKGYPSISFVGAAFAPQ